jgi:folate-binding protein YgfZ
MRELPLHSLHADLGAEFAARGDSEIVAAYGSASAEETALRESVGLVDRSDRGFVAVTGPEAKAYLHGMVTNEVKGLGPGQGAAVAVITSRGRMLADGRVLVLAEEQVLLDVPGETREAVHGHLDRFLVSEDCVLEDASGILVLFGVFGPRAGEVLAAVTGTAEVPALHHHRPAVFAGAEVRVIGAAPDGVPGFEVLAGAAAAAPVYEALLAAVRAAGGRPVGDRALDALRIERFVPRFGRDMTEETIPLEANLDHAISYSKGCYIGQEVIARATYRGAVNKRLARLRVPAGTAEGTRLVSGEKAVGTVTSVLPRADGAIALGYVRRDLLAPGARLTLEGGGEAEILEAPAERRE